VSLKVAIVGCGKIADGHVEEIGKMPELARVVAVCDLEPLMAEQLAMRYGLVRHYGDLGELLERERPDVVHVTTPPQSHLEITRRVVAAGCHVLVEKPLTLNHTDSLQLVEAVEKASRSLTIGYTYLFDPPAVTVRELVASGALGEVVHVESYFGYDLSGSFGSALLSDPNHWVHRLPGKLFHNNIDHMLNKALEFIPDEAPEVSAFATTRRERRFGDARDAMADELRVVLRGRRTTAYATFSGHARPAAHFLRVYGTRRSLHADFAGRTVVFDDGAKLPSAIGRLLPAFSMSREYAREGFRNVARFARSDYHFFAGLNRLLRLFYRGILDGGPPPIASRDILRVSAVMDEVFRQAAQGRADS
jgi:predicted dehydrogenase